MSKSGFEYLSPDPVYSLSYDERQKYYTKVEAEQERPYRDQQFKQFNPVFFSRQKDRLDTFKGREEYFNNFDAEDLSRYGLYAVESADPRLKEKCYLKCAFCPYELYNRKSRKVLAAHMHHHDTPMCPLVYGLPTNNEVYEVNESKEKGFEPQVDDLRYFVPGISAPFPLPGEADPKDNPACWSTIPKGTSILQVFAQSQNIPDYAEYSQQLAAYLNRKFFHLRQCHEHQRYYTYADEEYWPCHVPARDLARYGFESTHIKDRVECVFCGLLVENFQQNDLAFSRHLQLNPACPFILGQEVWNKPIASWMWDDTDDFNFSMSADDAAPAANNCHDIAFRETSDDGDEPKFWCVPAGFMGPTSKNWLGTTRCVPEALEYCDTTDTDCTGECNSFDADGFADCSSSSSEALQIAEEGTLTI